MTEGAAPTETGALPMASAPGCCCELLEEDCPLLKTFAGEVLVVWWGGGRAKPKLR